MGHAGEADEGLEVLGDELGAVVGDDPGGGVRELLACALEDEPGVSACPRSRELTIASRLLQSLVARAHAAERTRMSTAPQRALARVLNFEFEDPASVDKSIEQLLDAYTRGTVSVPRAPIDYQTLSLAADLLAGALITSTSAVRRDAAQALLVRLSSMHARPHRSLLSRRRARSDAPALLAHFEHAIASTPATGAGPSRVALLRCAVALLDRSAAALVQRGVEDRCAALANAALQCALARRIPLALDRETPRRSLRRLYNLYIRMQDGGAALFRATNVGHIDRIHLYHAMWREAVDILEREGAPSEYRPLRRDAQVIALLLARERPIGWELPALGEGWQPKTAARLRELHALHHRRALVNTLRRRPRRRERAKSG